MRSPRVAPRSSRLAAGAALALLALVAAACTGSDDAPAVSGSPASDEPLGEVLVDNTEPTPGEDEVVPPTPTPVPSPTPSPTPTPVPAVAEGDRPDPLDALAGIVPEVIRPPDASGPPTVAGVAANRVRIAGIVSETIGVAEVFAGACDGAQARIARYERERVNQQITGRFVQMVDCFDDEADPERNEQLVNDLVDGADTFAIVPATSVAFFADETLQQARIPYIGLGSQPGFCGPDRSFGFGQSGAVDCPVVETSGASMAAIRVLELYRLATGIDLAGLRVAVVAEDSLGGGARESAVVLEAELVGAEVVYRSTDVPPPSDPPRTDWDEVVGSILDADPQLVFIDGQLTEGLYAALRQAGTGADIVGTLNVDAAELAADPDLVLALSGSYFVSPGVDYTTRDSAEWGRLVIDMAAVGVDSADIDRSVVLGYAAADMFLAALGDTPDPLSTEAFHDLVNGGWEYPGIGRMVCGGWWPASHIVEYPCAALTTVSPIGEPLVTAVPLTDFNLALEM